MLSLLVYARLSWLCGMLNANNFSWTGVWSSFPVADDDAFENFFDFEQAVIDWVGRATRELSYCQLPVPIGRAYPRPRIVTQVLPYMGFHNHIEIIGTK